MEVQWKEFYKILDENLSPFIEKNIIIYGCNSGGDFVKWFLKKYYGKEIKAMIDRWELSKLGTVPHLWTFYYIYDKDDVIVNVTPKDIIAEFHDTGEDWQRTSYQKEQIINLWENIYRQEQTVDMENYPQTAYYDWLEYAYKGVDILDSVKRKFTEGKDAHGYFPTDFRIFIDGLSEFKISKEDAVLDIGCGKGSGIVSLRAAGFEKIGAVEYTEAIFQKMDANLQKLHISHKNLNAGAFSGGGGRTPEEAWIKCYQGDAMQLEEELDQYNWFFLFNPFTWEATDRMITNICSSIERRPRKVFIFYAEPIGHQMILDTGRFQLKKRICKEYADVSYYSYVYESI